VRGVAAKLFPSPPFFVSATQDAAEHAPDRASTGLRSTPQGTPGDSPSDEPRATDGDASAGLNAGAGLDRGGSEVEGKCNKCKECEAEGLHGMILAPDNCFNCDNSDSDPKSSN
jgi:hypothetical protein